MKIDYIIDYIFLPPIKVYELEKDKNREEAKDNELLDDSDHTKENEESPSYNKYYKISTIKHKKFRNMA